MSKQQQRHTQGPWTTRAGCVKDPIAIDCNYGAATIAYVNRHSGFDAPANARLIAAAPELLEALEFLVAASQTEPGMEICKAHILRAQSAVDKAKGNK